MAQIHNDGERTSFDKNFYKAALAFQESHRLTNGSPASEYQRRAFAFIQHIMPNLPQKYEPEDASEYLLNLMPPDLYEAGERLKFAARLAGRWHDLQYLIRMCGQEVFRKQSGAAPKPSFISVDVLQRYDLQLMAATVGADDLRLLGTDGTAPAARPDAAAFAGIAQGKK